MKIPTKPNHINSRLAYQEKHEERESWHRLAVKVISWKGGLLEGGIIKVTDKISPKEWATYSKYMIKTSTTYSRQRVLSNLKDTEEKIRKNGGFE
ncbi:hypothetical protein HYS97_00800 [Candidatus Daviesbacteria bacterium]|nr:hypothetical protein [Candidatus Daviesbacteria bacterium]